VQELQVVLFIMVHANHKSIEAAVKGLVIGRVVLQHVSPPPLTHTHPA